MPGYMIHLAVCEELIRKYNITDENFKASFRIGNIIPDVIQRGEKRLSHFWPDYEIPLLVRKPDLKAFLSMYEDNLKNPYVSGYYTHIKLDRYYLEKYWAKHFRFYNDSGKSEEHYDKVSKVYVTDTDRFYERERFFSDALYYGDYDMTNSYIANRYGISYKECLASVDLFGRLADKNIEIGSVRFEESRQRLLDLFDLKKNTAKHEMVGALPRLNVLNINAIDEMIEAFVEETQIQAIYDS